MVSGRLGKMDSQGFMAFLSSATMPWQFEGVLPSRPMKISESVNKGSCLRDLVSAGSPNLGDAKRMENWQHAAS